MRDEDDLEEIRKNQRIFNRIKDKIIAEKNVERQVEFIKLLSAFSINYHTGWYSDKDLELILVQVASSVHSDLKEDPKTKTCLHVVTRAYEKGGHTRVISNWVKQNRSLGFQDSVFFTDESFKKVPAFLSREISEGGGSIYFSSGKGFVNQGLELRTAASEYEYVVLHIHMNDVVPMIAFGTKRFSRPVIYFNHADHLFWLGFAISDVVAELSGSGKQFTKKNRGNTISGILPIPIEVNTCKSAPGRLKEELGITNEYKVISTMASPYKYDSGENFGFQDFIKFVLSKCSNVFFLVIGPSEGVNGWERLSKEDLKKVKFCGFLDKNKVKEIIQITDLYVDSFPYSSYTSFLEFAVCGVPSISYQKKSKSGIIDVMKLKGVSFNSVDHFQNHAIKIIRDEFNVGDKLKCQILKNHVLNQGWETHLSELYKSCNSHKLNLEFASKGALNENDFRILGGQKKTSFLMRGLYPVSWSKIYFMILVVSYKPAVLFQTLKNLYNYTKRWNK